MWSQDKTDDGKYYWRGRYVVDGIFKCLSLKENVWILIKISLKFVPKDPINNNQALVQIMV